MLWSNKPLQIGKNKLMFLSSFRRTVDFVAGWVMEERLRQTHGLRLRHRHRHRHSVTSKSGRVCGRFPWVEAIPEMDHVGLVERVSSCPAESGTPPNHARNQVIWASFVIFYVFVLRYQNKTPKIQIVLTNIHVCHLAIFRLFGSLFVGSSCLSSSNINYPTSIIPFRFWILCWLLLGLI